VDDKGNLYVADSGNHRIRKIDRNGTIQTVAGNTVIRFRKSFGSYTGDGMPAKETALYSPQDVALDKAGNLYIADTGNHRIRKIDSHGIIHTFAGHSSRTSNAAENR
jgi:DNA-binding beta-propeller fold protein YncE